MAWNDINHTDYCFITIMEDMGVTSWFSDPVYGRYWRHYQQAMSWQQRHLRAYRKALCAAYGPAYYHHWYPNAPQRYADWQGGESGGRAEERVSSPVEELGQETAGETDSEEGGDESDSDSEIECDVSNMEITEELRQYFAQTERHRDELKRQQEAEEQQAGYVLDDREMHRAAWQPGNSTLPPCERPGERRAAEMKALYGPDAAKIQGMEAAMQLCFDRHCDKKQPKYWPVIPLKL